MVSKRKEATHSLADNSIDCYYVWNNINNIYWKFDMVKEFRYKEDFTLGVVYDGSNSDEILSFVRSTQVSASTKDKTLLVLSHSFACAMQVGDAILSRHKELKYVKAEVLQKEYVEV